MRIPSECQRSERRYVSAITIAVLLFAACARGDMLVVQNVGNTIVPCEESDISMDAETVRIMPETKGGNYPSGYMVSCDFVLTNHSAQPLTRDMAFPVLHRRYRHVLSKYFQVSVEKNGESESLKTEVKMVADQNSTIGADVAHWEPSHDTLDYPGYVVWKQTFLPGQTQVVHCDYPMGQPREVYPRRPFKGVVFQYVVRTGALWKGKIGEATIDLDLGSGPFNLDGISMTYRDSVRWEDGTLVWHFRDWEPAVLGECRSPRRFFP